MGPPRTRWTLVLLLCATPAVAPAQSHPSGFLDRAISRGSLIHRYQVYVPLDHDLTQRWPVVLFLHGAGERGTDGTRATQVGLAEAIRWNREWFPALVVFPQVAWADSFWVGVSEDIALMELDSTIHEFNGAPNRLYLTGLSMGGFGTWRTAAEHPNRFAAIVPIAAGLLDPLPVGAPPVVPDPYAYVASRVKHIPVWVFHGANDTLTIPHARQMVEALRQAGANVQYTEYEDVGHEAWERAYRDPALWSWLFAQRRPGR